MDPRVWIWRFGTRCSTQCGVSYSHTQTCRFSFVCLFNWGFHFISGVVQNGYEILHLTSTQFLLCLLFSPFPCRDFSWFSLLKQGVTIAHRFYYLCASACIRNSFGPYGELSMNVSWNSHSLLLRHNLWQGGALWVDLQLSC